MPKELLAVVAGGEGNWYLGIGVGERLPLCPFMLLNLNKSINY